MCVGPYQYHKQDGFAQEQVFRNYAFLPQCHAGQSSFLLEGLNQYLVIIH